MRAQLRIIEKPIAPPETNNMKQRRYYTLLSNYVQGRSFITISEFAALTKCSKLRAGQKLKECRYLQTGLTKQFILDDVAGYLAKIEKCTH